ncbi:exodeoxyribonuclease 7 large subunit [Holospora undulata HU1]|uniref:Exodeoxyribonuclease VII large subunit n=1 Tax=Holospora undulata HU1 TaxID=1321371 RepID=A0A061JGJ9_9PROT|nr:exodeoxyribonuclease VII large subunit [Holospora undulata]ETZ04337.1 exodeoxyribonuclease 7 large subunit [Holospora undulata HU1]
MDSAVLTVTELSVQLKHALDAHFSQVIVQGEISGYKQHVSGHHYFSLKDDKSVIDGVCWKGTSLKMVLKDGMQVLCQGRVSVYGARSKYQLLVSHIQEQGKGVLLEQLERLKAKLQLEGVFSQKRSLPLFPQHLGILTSPTGAVIQDMLDRCKARWPCRITVFPIQVQGGRVTEDVLQGLRFFHALCEEERPEILIIARGGGV